MISSAIGNSGTASYVSANSVRAASARARSAAAGTSANTSHNSDYYTRTAAKNAATYSRAAQNPFIKNAPDITSIVGRQQAAKDYDAILADLRKNYSEPEAMYRFDEIMRADGFERVEYTNARLPLSGPNSSAFGLNQRITEILPTEYVDAINSLPRDTASKNMVLHSSMFAAMQGDDAGVGAESWAIYGADRPYSEEMQAAWRNRYMDSSSLNGMEGLPDAAQRSVVSESGSFASLVSDILAENGITLGRGEYLEFRIGQNMAGEETVSASGNWGYDKYPSSLFESFDNPEFLSALKASMANPPLESPSSLGGEFEDGDRSVEYSVSRSVLFSADNPSSAVVNDRLGITGKGYTYVKKAGDYFDPEAGNYSVSAQPPMMDLMIPGERKDGYMLNRSKMQGAVNNALAEALETGKPVAGSVTRGDVDKAFADSMAARNAYNDQFDWYDSTGEIIDHAGDGKGWTPEQEFGAASGAGQTPKAKADGKADSEDEPDVEPEPSVYLEDQKAPRDGIDRLADFRTIIADLNMRYSAINTLIRPPSVAKRT